jgi:hypothetical protein
VLFCANPVIAVPCCSDRLSTGAAEIPAGPGRGRTHGGALPPTLALCVQRLTGAHGGDRLEDPSTGRLRIMLPVHK